MVDKIEINYQNKLIILDKKKQIFLVNAIKKDFKEELFNKLLNIMSLWKNNYSNNEIVDGITFIIKIYTSSELETIVIKNDFPINFQEFLDILGEL